MRLTPAEQRARVKAFHVLPFVNALREVLGLDPIRYERGRRDARTQTHREGRQYAGPPIYSERARACRSGMAARFERVA